MKFDRLFFGWPSFAFNVGMSIPALVGGLLTENHWVAMLAMFCAGFSISAGLNNLLYSKMRDRLFELTPEDRARMEDQLRQTFMRIKTEFEAQHGELPGIDISIDGPPIKTRH